MLPLIDRGALEARVELERAQQRLRLIKPLDLGAIKRHVASAPHGFAIVTGVWSDWHTAVRGELGRRAAQVERAMHHASGIYMRNRLHRMRVAAKKLRYNLELADMSQIASSRDLLGPLKTVQDVLGEIHDYEVLAERVRECLEGSDMSPRDSALLDALMDMERHRLHGRYLKQRDRIRDVCRTCRLIASAGGRRLERPAAGAAVATVSFTAWYWRTSQLRAVNQA